MKLTSLKCAAGLGVIAAVIGVLAAGPVWAQAADEPPETSAGETDAPPGPNDPGFILEDRPSYERTGDNQCIFFRTLYDWRPLNDTHLIVWAPSRKHPYLIQLDRPCWGLRFAQSLGFYSRDSSLCSYGGDAVVVNDGITPERCTIGAITKLNEEALQSILDQAPGRRRASQDEKEDSGDSEE